jgi:DtxR family Mn-dependent transcriptional regulator
MATQPVEDLLATIYRLTREAPYAHTKDIAKALGVSQPTVSEKIVRLADQGYVDHKWRKGAALTEEGRRVAIKTLRKHRLIETFLVNLL